MRKVLALGVLALLTAPTSALAADRRVTIEASTFSPRLLTVIRDDAVVWTNGSFAEHNVTATSFPSSGNLTRGQTHRHTFGSLGTFDYRCTLHIGMQGTVKVVDLHLAAPFSPVLYGSSATLTGLAPPGSAVTIKRLSDGVTVATVTAGATGAFSASVAAPAPASYEASAAGRTSAPVRVGVRARIAVSARRVAAGRFVVRASTSPAQAGAAVALQRYVGSRWVTLARAGLNASSRATFRVTTRTRWKVRVKQLRGVGGYSPGTSKAIVIRP